jgi:hypothetical protein
LKTLLIILLCGLAARLFAQQPVVEEPRVRFRAVDIYVNSTNALLAAYQIEFSVTNVLTKIVGVEGGEHPAFREAPFYDSKAIQQERVIIAAFSANAGDKLPVGKTRVATIHIQTTGAEAPRFNVKLQTAAEPGGNKIAAGVTAEERKTP